MWKLLTSFLQLAYIRNCQRISRNIQKKIETFKNTVTSGKIDRTREGMIKHVIDTLSTPYNPKNPDAKTPTKAPRDTVWIK